MVVCMLNMDLNFIVKSFFVFVCFHSTSSAACTEGDIVAKTKSSRVVVSGKLEERVFRKHLRHFYYKVVIFNVLKGHLDSQKPFHVGRFARRKNYTECIAPALPFGNNYVFFLQSSESVFDSSFGINIHHICAFPVKLSLPHVSSVLKQAQRDHTNRGHDCVSKVCLNGGSCQWVPSSAQEVCLCMDGYDGEVCQNDDILKLMALRTAMLKDPTSMPSRLILIVIITIIVIFVSLLLFTTIRRCVMKSSNYNVQAQPSRPKEKGRALTESHRRIFRSINEERHSPLGARSLMDKTNNYKKINKYEFNNNDTNIINLHEIKNNDIEDRSCEANIVDKLKSNTNNNNNGSNVPINNHPQIINNKCDFLNNDWNNLNELNLICTNNRYSRSNDITNSSPNNNITSASLPQTHLDYLLTNPQSEKNNIKIENLHSSYPNRETRKTKTDHSASVVDNSIQPLFPSTYTNSGVGAVMSPNRTNSKSSSKSERTRLNAFESSSQEPNRSPTKNDKQKKSSIKLTSKVMKPSKAFLTASQSFTPQTKTPPSALKSPLSALKSRSSNPSTVRILTPPTNQSTSPPPISIIRTKVHRNKQRELSEEEVQKRKLSMQMRKRLDATSFSPDNSINKAIMNSKGSSYIKVNDDANDISCHMDHTADIDRTIEDTNRSIIIENTNVDEEKEGHKRESFNFNVESQV